MARYHDVTALLAWLEKFEHEGAQGTLGAFTKAVADEVRTHLGEPVHVKPEQPGQMWEIQELPRGLGMAWTEDQNTGEGVCWVAVPMVNGPGGGYGRLWQHADDPKGARGRFTDLELLVEHGTVYSRNPDGS